MIESRRRAHHQPAGGFDGDAHVSKFQLNAFRIGEAAAELFVLAGMSDGGIEGALGETHG